MKSMDPCKRSWKIDLKKSIIYIDMNSDVAKFQSLEVNKMYEEKWYKGPFTSKYGNSYILHILDEGSNESFNMYATKN